MRGTLAQRPLPELLVALLDSSAAGTLVLQEPSGAKSAVLIVRGAPAKARLADNPVLLGALLVELGLLPESEKARHVDEAVRSKERLGQALVDQGLLDPVSLFGALREQLHRQVLFLCDLPGETAFGLYQANYLDGWGGSSDWRAKPLPLIWRALVDKAPRERVSRTIEGLGDRKLRMRFEAPVARFRMEKPEAAVINVLRAKPQTIRELLGCGLGAEERVHRILYALCCTRQLELGVDLAPPVGSAEPPESPQSVPPPSRSTPRAVPAGGSVGKALGGSRRPNPTPPKPRGDVQAFREEVMARRELENADFYRVLGLEPKAEAAAVRAAFFQLAKRWHPDRLGPELEDLRDEVTRAFARMSEAYQVLNDEEQRARYDASLEEGGDEEQEEVLAVLRAAAAFQRAEVLVKKRDDLGALEEARAAYQGDPSQAEYMALYAWLESKQRKEGGLDDLLSLLDDAVRGEPDNVRIRWYRAQLFKRMGREVHAIRDFRHIVGVAPGHVEAQRELRVYEMRRKAESTPEANGLFARWRKK